MASAPEGGADYAWGVAGSSALTTQGEFYYQTQSEGATYGYDVLRRLSDGAALAVVRTPVRCIGVSSTAGAPFVFGFLNADTKTRWMGYYSLDAGAFVPGSNVFSDGAIMDSAFSWSGGVGFLDLGGFVDVLFGGQTPLKNIFAPTSFATMARAQPSANLVAWIDQSTFPSTIRGWTPTGGAQPLVQGTNYVVAMGLGDQNIAILDVTGVQWQAGEYDTARISWASLTPGDAGFQLHAGPDVSGKVGGGPQTLSTAGDYIGVDLQVGYALSPSAIGVLVVQISTGKVWTISSRPNMIMTFAGISGAEILAFESDLSFSKVWGDTYFQRWLRLDLTKLDQLVTTLPAGM